MEPKTNVVRVGMTKMLNASNLGGGGGGKDPDAKEFEFDFEGLNEDLFGNDTWGGEEEW